MRTRCRHYNSAEPSRAEPSRAERAEPSRAEPSRAEPSRAEPPFLRLRGAATLGRFASRPEPSRSPNGRSATPRPASSSDSFAPTPARAAAGSRAAARNPRRGLLPALLCLPLFLGFAAVEAQAQTLSISAPADANEGDSSTRDLAFTVTLSAARSTNPTNYRVCFTGTATIDTTRADPIPAAADYQPLTIVSGSSFATASNCWDSSILQGDTSSVDSVGIRVKGDTDAEADETVIATLSLRGSNEGVTLGTSVVTHTILDDDTPAPEISVSLPISEGESRSDAGEKKVPESEGSVGIGFNLAADQPLPSALTVCVRVTESGGDRVASGSEGIQTANMPSSVTNGSGTHTLTWTNTAADDQDSSVTVEAVAPNTVGCSAANDSYTVSSSDASDKLLIQDDENTTVELTASDPTMTEGDASDTATLTISLDRRLYAGETIGVPIALASATGARLPGSVDGGSVANHDFAVAAAAGSGHSGVTLTNALTANPRVVFTGHDTNTVQTATVTLTPVASRDDGDAAHETITATLSSLGLLDTTVSGVAAHASNNAATLTLEDDEAPPAACPAQDGIFSATNLRILENGETTYCVRLTTAPSGGNTVVTIVRNGGNRFALDPPATLTFTASDYMNPQQVTVTGADEPNTHRNRPDVRLTHTANGGGYTSQNLGDVRVEVDDAPELEAFWHIKGNARIQRPHTVTSTPGLTPWQNAAPGYELAYVVRLSNRPEPDGTVTVTATVPSDKRNFVGLSLTGPSVPLDGPAYHNWATNLPGTVDVEFKDRSPGAGTGCSNWLGLEEHEYIDSRGYRRTVSGGGKSESYDGTADTPWECWRMIYVVRKPASRNIDDTCADITHTATGGGVRKVTVDTVRAHVRNPSRNRRGSRGYNSQCRNLTGNTLPPQGSPAQAAPAPTEAVANVQVTAVNDGSASVTWDAVPHATSYDVSWSAESSDSLNASAGSLPGVTGTSTTIRHDASVPMTLTVTVTPEYVDEHGDTQQLDALAGTATLVVGPSDGNLGGDGDTDGSDDDDGPMDSGEGKVDLPAPVAHWRFDGDADDAAGSSDGTAVGGAAFAANGEGEGVGSHALSLDGVDDHVDLGSHVSNFPLGDAARTVTGWFHADAGAQGQSFFSYGPNVAGQRFSIAADRTQVVVGVSGHGWGVTGLDLADGWHHVAVSYAGGDSDDISIYLDGALQSASTQAGSPQGLDTRSGPAAIGRSVSGTHYTGSIDDVRIYDVALSAEQVAALIDEQQPPPPPPPAPPSVSIPAPVAHWTFDGDADDSAGSNDGTAMNGASFTTSASVGSHALSLDGVDDHVDLASHVSSFPLGDAARSVTGWFRADAGSQGQSFFSYGPNVAGQRFSVAADRTQVAVGVSSHGRGVNGLSLQAGWRHVAVTYAGGDSDGISIYLDGVLQSASTLAGSARRLDTRTGPAVIGRSVSGTKHYAGLIDDVRLYDVALSAEQVQAIANREESAQAAATTPGPGAQTSPSALREASSRLLGAPTSPSASAGSQVHVPLLPGSLNPLREGLVRIVNRSAQAGEVRIVAVDDAGWRSAPVLLGLGAGESAQFTSRDLEWGNEAQDLTGATGPGTGDWRLEIASDLEIDVLPYVRSHDGALHAMGDVAPVVDDVHRVALFAPADSLGATGKLRLTNRGGQTLRADITGIDDAGASPGGTVSVEIAAGASVVLTAAGLEAGGANLGGGLARSLRNADEDVGAPSPDADGDVGLPSGRDSAYPGGQGLPRLGDGQGQWRLRVASDGDLAVMNLIETSDGRLANLSAVAATAVSAREAHVVAHFPSTAEGSAEQGVVRIVNSSGNRASIRIEPQDSTGWRYPSLTLTLGAGEAANLGAWDLEQGNRSKGLAGSVGPGTGGPWRLEISSNTDIEVLAFSRSADGLLGPLPGDTAAGSGVR